MELLMIILNREEHLETILSILVELEVSGATILNSEGLGHFLAYEVPIFAGLRHLVGERKTENKMILALVENKEFFAEFKKMLAAEKIDFTEPGTGVILTIPVNQAVKSEDVV
jgi:nitrogen regulatory protein P-II 1